MFSQKAPAIASVALKQNILKGRAKVVKSLTVNQEGLSLGPSVLLLPGRWGEVFKLSELLRVGE